MRPRPSRPCAHPTCPDLATTGTSHCEHHQPEPWHHPNRIPLPPGWNRLRRRHLRHEPACRTCGQPATDVDHIIPRSQGGSDADWNIQSLCAVHHAEKTAAEAAAARRRVG